METTGAELNPPEGEYVTINVFGCGDSGQDCCVFQSIPYVDDEIICTIINSFLEKPFIGKRSKKKKSWYLVEKIQTNQNDWI